MQKPLLHVDTVDRERIKLLYQAGQNGLIGGFLIIFLFPLFAVNHLNHNTLLLWLLLVLAVNIPRVFLLRSFQHRLNKGSITNSNAKKWEKYFILGFILSGCGWATTPFLPYHSNITLCILFVVTVQIGINAVVVAAYSSSKTMVLIYLTITFVPALIKAFSILNYSMFVVGLTGVCFYIILVRGVSLHHKNLIKIITLKIENDEASRKDSLTKLWNRKQLYEFMEKLIPRCKRHSETFVILLIDIDHFKKYNDSKGHSAGDKALKKVAKTITDAIRQEDLAVRYGGEEFLVVFPLINMEQAVVAAERIRDSIKKNTDVTVSGGLAEFDQNISFDEMTILADDLLYKAKEHGRDRVLQPF